MVAKRFSKKICSINAYMDKVNTHLRFSSMVFQMAAVIGLGVWGGRKLDQYIGLKFPAFTLVFLFVGIFVGMYWSLKDLLKKKD